MVRNTLMSFGLRSACVVSASVLNVVELTNSVIALATVPGFPLAGRAAVASPGFSPLSMARNVAW
jgi:hypothetical protein